MIDEALFSSARTDTGSDSWGTPAWLYAYLNETYKFNLDPCADDLNHLCEKYYTEQTDGLKQVWEGRAFVNPPYSEAKKWMQKAFDSCKEGTAELVVCLIPARTETEFWHEYVNGRALQVFFVRGRLVFVRTQAELETAAKEWFAKRKLEPSEDELFDKVEDLKLQSAPFPSAIVVYHRDAFKLGTLGKTQYSCLDLRSVQPKPVRAPRRAPPKPKKARAQATSPVQDIRPAVLSADYGDDVGQA